MAGFLRTLLVSSALRQSKYSIAEDDKQDTRAFLTSFSTIHFSVNMKVLIVVM